MNKETIRAEVTRKNEYWLPRHRYYELKHFCLQYPNHKHELETLNGYTSPTGHWGRYPWGMGDVSDPTSKAAIEREKHVRAIDMVEKALEFVDPKLARYILIGVTEGLPYNMLNARYDVPCGKNLYYDEYRKFFWHLSEIRG